MSLGGGHTDGSPAKRGLLIVFEGLDRSGKTTQSRRLVDALQTKGLDVRHMRFPDRNTSIGASIDAYLRAGLDLEDHVVHLLFSANRWEYAPSIREHLLGGTILVVDRYSYSGAVYSAAKDNPELSLEWAWQPEVGLPAPDQIFYLTVSEQVAESRGGFGEERYEKRELQRRVADLFLELFKTRLGMKEPAFKSVDADGDADAVHSEILTATLEALDAHRDTNTGIELFGPLQTKP